MSTPLHLHEALALDVAWARKRRSGDCYLRDPAIGEGLELLVLGSTLNETIGRIGREPCRVLVMKTTDRKHQRFAVVRAGKNEVGQDTFSLYMACGSWLGDFDMEDLMHGIRALLADDTQGSSNNIQPPEGID